MIDELKTFWRFPNKCSPINLFRFSSLILKLFFDSIRMLTIISIIFKQLNSFQQQQQKWIKWMRLARHTNLNINFFFGQKEMIDFFHNFLFYFNHYSFSLFNCLIFICFVWISVFYCFSSNEQYCCCLSLSSYIILLFSVVGLFLVNCISWVLFFFYIIHSMIVQLAKNEQTTQWINEINQSQ